MINHDPKFIVFRGPLVTNHNILLEQSRALHRTLLIIINCKLFVMNDYGFHLFDDAR